MSARRAFVTLLATPDYLPGVAALSVGLRRSRSRYPLFVLVTDDLPSEVARRAARCAAGTIRVEPIANPAPGDTFRHWNQTYSKLRMFGLTQFEKVVFIDADMLVCANVDDLFERPHFSAVNSGGLLPERAGWNDLNSGLLVIEPHEEQYQDMLAQVGRLKTKDHGDQTFLHAYLPDWPRRTELHLDHGYNMFFAQLDRHAELFGYRFPNRDEVRNGSSSPGERLIRIVHFVGGQKPWHRGARVQHLLGYLRRREGPLQFRASRLWYLAEWEARVLGRAQR